MARRIAAALFLLVSSLAAQDKPVPKPGTVLLDEDYAKPEAVGKWSTVGGHWAVKDGMLMGTVANRKSPHLVYSRRYHDITLTARFMLVDNVGLIIRFEGPAGAQSAGVLVSRDALLIQKLQARDDTHVEKGKLVDLGRAAQKLELGRWYDLTLSVVGNQLKASVEGGGSVSAKSPDLDTDRSEIDVIYSGGVGYLRKLKAVVPGP